MHPALQALLLAAALAGHATLWVGVVNRIHGVGIRRWIVDAITMASGLVLAGVPMVVCWQVWRGAAWPTPFASTANGPMAWYAAACALLVIAAAAWRAALARHPETTGGLLSQRSQTLDLARRLGAAATAPGLPRLLSRLPGNQLLRPELTHKELLVPSLPPALDGLRIAHLSDLHMSGRVAVGYFREIVDATLAEQPDLIALTGDLVEYDAQLPWIAETLARLHAPHGVYFVRGNHDKKMDHARTRQALSAAGHVDLAHTWRTAEIRGRAVRLVGNELPWFSPAGDPAGGGGPADLIVGLAHGPDQFAWAQRHGVNLLLAGHNHGGQIRVPLLGAMVTPSLHGTRYACGVFRRGATVMHVTRGAGSLAPLRWNCPPELAVLTLRGGAA
ncbi:MAG: metallophosphoesterase [Planctomycetota bacterium]